MPTPMLLLLSGKTGSNRWQLDSKTEKVTSLSPGRDNLANIQAKLTGVSDRKLPDIGYSFKNENWKPDTDS